MCSGTTIAPSRSSLREQLLAQQLSGKERKSIVRFEPRVFVRPRLLQAKFSGRSLCFLNYPAGES
jgi:hypothetical protein